MTNTEKAIPVTSAGIANKWYYDKDRDIWTKYPYGWFEI